jgi:ubiquinone/menaquinone biosynthesis C-methylase UbiE
VGFYDRYLLPRILDLAMRNKDIMRLRAAWVPRARGTVLEVGIGSGLNLAFYPSAAERIIGIDPSLELQRIARKRAGAQQRAIESLSQRADDPLPLPAASVDTVLSTWTLCTIPNALRALQEMKRVLRPGGQFIFIEHGRSPLSGVAAWQDRLTPVWKHIGGGCHLNRKIDELIESAGFRIAEMKVEYLPGPRPMTHTFHGLAR